MQKFIHIGYPKCFSTTLQREFFSIHPGIHYGGIGTGDNNIDFINDEINLLVESGLIYFRNVLYQKEKKRFASAVANFIEEAESLDKKLVGISSEHLSFSFTPQTIDPDIKLDRLKELFGGDTKIIIVLREQLSLVASLYREYVNMGYQYNFGEFLTWLYAYQDRNFYNELFYSKVLEAVFKRFNKENVLILLFEDYKNGQYQNLNPKIFTDIADFFGIERVNINALNKNPSLTDAEVALRLEANKLYQYDFGSSVLYGVENHRRRVYFNKYLELGLSEEKLFDNVIKKRMSRAYTVTKFLSSKSIFMTEEKILNKMSEAWKNDNSELSILLNRDINTLFNRSFNQVVESINKKNGTE